MLKESTAANSATRILVPSKTSINYGAFSERQKNVPQVDLPVGDAEGDLGSREQYRVEVWICLGSPEFWEW